MHPMTTLLPDRGVIQLAFVVEHVERAMELYSERMKAGPWFLRPRFKPLGARHRGGPTDLELSLAFGYAGPMMIELIEQHGQAPSVFREVVETKGYGLHHLGVAAPDFDGALAHYRATGYEVGFEARRQARVAILDTLRDLPFMVELLEITPPVESFFDMMHRASVGWDGSDPVRLLPP